MVLFMITKFQKWVYMGMRKKFKKLSERASKHTTGARIIFRVGYSFSELGKFPPEI